MKIAAPIWWGMLGKKARQKERELKGDLGGLLEGMLGGSQTEESKGF